MSKYRVAFCRTQVIEIEVEADNRELAITEAKGELLMNGFNAFDPQPDEPEIMDEVYTAEGDIA